MLIFEVTYRSRNNPNIKRHITIEAHSKAKAEIALGIILSHAVKIISVEKIGKVEGRND